MPQSPSWSDLKVGLIALGALAGLAVAVVMFAEVGAVRGSKVSVFVLASETGGLMNGGEVYISGKKVGKVKDISFRTAATDTTERLLIRAEVLERTLPLIRRDSYAEIRPAGTFIGTPILDIAAGSSTADPVSAGDTVRSKPIAMSQGVMARVATLGKEVTALRNEVTGVITDMKSVRGTFGAMRVEGPADMARLGASFSRFHARLTRGGGTASLIMNDPAFGARLSAIRADVDSIRLLATSRRGNVGRFRRDTTLASSLTRVRADVVTLRAALADSRGTAGRAMNDRAIQRELVNLGRELDALIADFKRNPFRYIVF